MKLLDNKIALFSVLSLWLCIEFIILGPYSYIRVFDYADSLMSVQHALKANLFSYGMTNWFQYMGSGVDRLADEYCYSYIPQLLALIFPIWLSNFIHIFFQYFLAMYFVFRICKEQLVMSDSNSILAGVLFAVFCEFNVMLLGIYAFPMTIYYFDKIYQLPKKIHVCFLMICLGLLTSLLSAVVYLPYSLLSLAVWFLVVKRKDIARFLIVYMLYCFVIVLIKAPSLIAYFLNTPLSHRDFLIRGYKSLGQDFFFALIGRSLPWVFPSIVTTAFLILGLYFSRLKDRKFNVFFLLFLVMTVGACILNVLKFLLHISLAGYQFDRFFLISPIFYSIAIAYSLQYFTDKKIRIRILNKALGIRSAAYIIVCLSVFFSTASIKVARAKEWIRYGSYYANYHSRQMQRIADQNKLGGPFRVATAVSLIFPAYAMSYGLESSDGYFPIYPARYKRFWTKVIEPILGKNEQIANLFNNWGCRVYLFPPTEVPDAEIVFKDYYNLNLLSLANTKYIISRSKLIDDNLVLVQEPKSAFYQLSRRAQIEMRVKENFTGNDSLFVYENISVLPRFFVTKRVNLFDSDDELLHEISTASITSLKETIYLSAMDVEGFDPGTINAEAAEIDMVHYSPDVVRLHVRLVGKGFLVISNSYSPFWKVDINGKPDKVVPADHAFMGVLLEEEKNDVTFYYDPPYNFTF